MFRTDLIATLFVLTATCVEAQQLRHATWNADLIVVAKVEGVRPLGNEVMLHTLRPTRTLKGEILPQVTIVETKRASDQPKPVLGKPRIYCLKVARNVDLPERHGPFYRMTGFRGDHPLVSDDPAKPNTAMRLVECLLAAEDGQSPELTCRTLVQLGLTGEGPAATEAIEVLRERTAVSDRLDDLQRSDLLARAVGETNDVDLKIALASLCAEQKMRGIIDAFCLSIEESPNERFARTVGRLAKFAHGEGAFDVLRPHIARARTPAVKDQLLLALGATQTDKALNALLRYRELHGAGKAVDAALAAHGSKRAKEAIANRRR